MNGGKIVPHRKLKKNSFLNFRIIFHRLSFSAVKRIGILHTPM